MKSRRTSSILIPTLVLALMLTIVGCGGSSSGGDDTQGAVTITTIPTGSGGSTTGDEDMEQAMLYALIAIEDNTQDAMALEAVNSSMNQMGFVAQTLTLAEGDVGTTSQSQVDADFLCGNVSTEGLRTIVYTFNGAEECGGVSGTVKRTIEREQGESVQYKLEYIDFNTGDCIVDGEMLAAIEKDGSTVSSNLTYDDLSICGETLDGTAEISYNTDTGDATIEMSAQSHNYNNNGSTISVESTITYNTSSGVNGDATVVDSEGTYLISIENMKIDWTCGVPVGGVITVTGVDGDTLTADFSGVSCSNPVAVYTLSGEGYSYNLNELMALYLTLVE